MKNQILRFVMALGMLAFSGSLIAQDIKDLGFQYQAVARDNSGLALANKSIVVEISIRKGSTTGATLWQESHQLTTNKFGLFNVVIGKGLSTGIGSLNSFNDIDWSSADYFTNVRADFGNGLLSMGAVKLQAIPYAFVADTALAAPRFPMNELLDVDVTNLTTNDVLRWDGTNWIPSNFTSDFDAVYAKINADSTAIGTRLDTEIADRIAGDNTNAIAIATTVTDITMLTNKQLTDSTALRGLINTNISDISTNTSGLASEVNRATTAEGVNATAITAEQTRATAAESTLTTDLATEITNRIAGDNANATNISTNTANIATNVTNISTNTSGLAAEITRATAAEGVNSTAITAEETRALAAETTLTTNLATEVADRIAGDATKADLTLSNLSNTATSRTNLGLGTIATQSVAYTLPATDGLADQVLKTDGSGTVSWGTDIGASSLDELSDVKIGGTDFSGSMLLGNITTGVLSNAYSNTGYGTSVFRSLTSGYFNTAIGSDALYSNTNGGNNTALGGYSLNSNIDGSGNTAVGLQASRLNTSGYNNTSLGLGSLYANTTGFYNLALGANSASTNITGDKLSLIGAESDVTVDGLTNATAIGYGAEVDASNKIQLGDANVTSVSTSGKLTTGAVTYPNTDGTSGQVLSTDGSGNASWTTVSSGSNSAPSRISMHGFANELVDFSFTSGLMGASSTTTDATSLGSKLSISSVPVTYNNGGSDITATTNEFHINTSGVYEVFITLSANNFATGSNNILQLAKNSSTIAASVSSSDDKSSGNPATMVIKYVGSFSINDVISFHYKNVNGNGWRGKAISIDIQKIN